MTVATASTLEFFLNPLSLTSFLDEHWERGPLFVSREHERGYFADLFTLDALDELLARADLWHPNVRIFHSGEQLMPTQFSKRWAYGHEVHDRVVDREEVLRLFQRGATINLLGIERTWPSVMRASKSLEIEAGFPVHTTAFLSPPDAANIPPHYDMVDVFVVQISGTKEWGVWEPSRTLPLTTDTTARIFSSADVAVSEDRLVGRYLLKPGDTLYVPRGALHEAVTTHETSLHLAFGINPHRWYDLFELVARDAIRDLARGVDFRRALPAGRSGANGRAGATESETLVRLATEFAARVDTGLAHNLVRLDERFLNSRAPARPGQLTDISRAESLSLDDRLVVRPDLAYGITQVADRLKLVFHQKSLTLGLELRRPLDFVCSGSAFRIGDIPELSNDKRLQFAQRLLVEGLLTSA